MKKMILLYFVLATTKLNAEVYCRVEPVSANGDDYFSLGMTVETACEKALTECEAHYKNCVVLACGRYEETKNTFNEPCNY